MEQRAVAEHRERVPAHVRHGDARRLGQARDAAGDQAERGGVALLRPLEQQLLAEAEADGRLGEPADDVDEPARAQLAHALLGGADAGQDDAVGRADHGRVGRQLRAHAEPLEREAHRGDVGAAAVDDDGHQSTPFELGISEPAPRATAGRRARPKPLKSASTMWWALSPVTFRWSVAASVSLTDLKK